MESPSAVSIRELTHRYGEFLALDRLSLEVPAGTIFGLLGPNGSGKTTLFRLLSTLLPLQQGTLELLGEDVARHPERVRQRIGVTFQSPSLDTRLTVTENLVCQGQLYGLSGTPLKRRIAALLERFRLADRAGDRVESLSGGMKRRVEIVKGLLHDPGLLLLDEPTTGLDPAARRDVWEVIRELQAQGVGVLVTTHIMEEAELCDSLAILDRGRLIAEGTPAELRSSVGGDCLTLQSRNPAPLARAIAEQFSLEARRLGDGLRIEHPRGHELLRELVEAFPEEITSVTLGKPTLEDVFIARTGHRFDDQPPSPGDE